MWMCVSGKGMQRLLPVIISLSLSFLLTSSSASTLQSLASGGPKNQPGKDPSSQNSYDTGNRLDNITCFKVRRVNIGRLEVVVMVVLLLSSSLLLLVVLNCKAGKTGGGGGAINIIIIFIIIIIIIHSISISFLALSLIYIYIATRIHIYL